MPPRNRPRLPLMLPRGRLPLLPPISQAAAAAAQRFQPRPPPPPGFRPGTLPDGRPILGPLPPGREPPFMLRPPPPHLLVGPIPGLPRPMFPPPMPLPRGLRRGPDRRQRSRDRSRDRSRSPSPGLH